MDLPLLLFLLLLLSFLENHVSFASKSESSNFSGKENHAPQRQPHCTLYLAESQLGGLGVYAGVDIPQGDVIGQGDLVVPVIDANIYDGVPDIFWDAIFAQLFFENLHDLKVFMPGIGSLGACHDFYANVDTGDIMTDSAGVHRGQDPGAGAFCYHHNHSSVAKQTILAGQELFTDCGRALPPLPEGPVTRLPEWLKTNAICIDTLLPGLSTLPGAGRGAFARSAHAKGSVVTASPLLPLDRHYLDIFQQTLKYEVSGQFSTPVYKSEKQGKQLLLNYCFGHKESNLLLLPYGPMVNLINHNGQDPNVAIRWSKNIEGLNDLFSTPWYDLLELDVVLMIDYVALRDIEQGEEIVLDYGMEWENAWKQHCEDWTRTEAMKEYVSASEYVDAHSGSKIFRTEKEQNSDPYPKNLQTTCFFMPTSQDADHRDRNGEIIWREANDNCIRLCDILHVSPDGIVKARMQHIDAYQSPRSCDLVGDNITVTGIPPNRVKLVDLPYTSDVHLPAAFRHEIGGAQSLFTQSWMIHQQVKPVKFAAPLLQDGEVSPLKTYSGAAVSENVFRVGVPSLLREGLLNYLNRMGITSIFEYLLIDGNPLAPGSNQATTIAVDKYKWNVQRKNFQSNIHELYPSDEQARQNFLQVLGEHGFDGVLDTVGREFGMDGLLCCQMAFEAFSYCSHDKIYHGFSGTGGKAFTLTIPLMLAQNKTGLDLELILDGGAAIGGNFELDVAIMTGDDTGHAVAPCDYRDQGEMQILFTILIADVNMMRAEAIAEHLSQSHRLNQQLSAKYLSDQAGNHWSAYDPNKKLPQSSSPSDFRVTPLEPGEILPLVLKNGLKNDNSVRMNHVYRIGLPQQLSKTLSTFASRMGISGVAMSLIRGNETLPPDYSEEREFMGYKWMIQSRPSSWDSDMIWISPGDAIAWENVLTSLGAGGFDGVLSSFGRYFGFDGLAIYHLTFAMVSHCKRGYGLGDKASHRGRLFKVVIPLVLARDSDAELEILDVDGHLLGKYRYEMDVGALVGDSARYTIGQVDYGVTGEVRLSVIMYIGDASMESAEDCMDVFAENFFPTGGKKFGLDRAPYHWKADDPTKKLPHPDPKGDFETHKLEHGEISDFRWKANGEIVCRNIFRVGLPEKVAATLRDFAERMGIMDEYRSLLIEGKALKPGRNKFKSFGHQNWYIQRPPASSWTANMHWISPADEEAHFDFLKVLSASGFDDVIESIGKRFDLGGMLVYHITFIGLSHCEQGKIHYDFSKVDDKAFNVIIPLVLANLTTPELDIRRKVTTYKGRYDIVSGYKYEHNIAAVTGDDAVHNTAACNYLDQKEMRVMATLYMADVTESNVASIAKDFTQVYPKKFDTKYLMDQVGDHWSPDDPSKHLPRSDTCLAQRGGVVEL